MGAPLIDLMQFTSVAAAVLDRARRRPRQIAVERPSALGAAWEKIPASSLGADIRAAGLGWIGLGFKPGDAVSILGSTSYEWMVMDLGAQAAGLVTVPIYETDSYEQVKWIAQKAQVKAVITDSTVQANMVRQLDKEPELAGQISVVFSLDDSGFTRLLEHGRAISAAELDERLEQINTDDLCTIVFTSGTTGRPKGVEITHGNFLRPLNAVIERRSWNEWIYDPGARVIYFLPVAHVLARFLGYQQLVGHGTAAFLPNAKTIVKDIQTFKPNALLVVPRVLEKIYNAADATAGSGIKLRIFRLAAHTAEQWARAQESGKEFSFGQKLKISLARKLVLNKIKKLMGGNLQGIVSGGAPMAERLGRFFIGCGIEVLQGYGATETTGPLTMSDRIGNKTGYVGHALLCNEVRLGKGGELQARGGSIMRGYYGEPDLTREAFTEDGWLKTGDIAQIDADGNVKITGRAKEIIVTAGGKNVAPEYLEERLKGHPLISQVMVVGDNKPFVAALVTLDKEMLPTWLKNHGMEQMDITRAARDPRVLEALQRAVQRTNRAVSRAESIRKIKVITTDWTTENGMLTPSLKIKRNQIRAVYGEQIEDLFTKREEK
ncbi:AMP-dependent synthetase/ligase [Varibaculum prostatecancerukia]|uniref:AMP-dependent synthetase/ligase n=1 Tax=Varibaculum prostatecancerukia TaxID=2811781 RepID=UPI001C000169|nr:AMP-dependent synthetase/ligase [Varibaculum prostatecancerukia]